MKISRVLLQLAICFATVSTAHAQIDKQFSTCVMSEAKSGDYSSFDGGISAVKILQKCDSSYEPWVDSCKAQPDTTKNCITKAAIIAQTALKMNGK